MNIEQIEEIVSSIGVDTRLLSEEELNTEITWERIRDFHYTVGEDFLDQTAEGNVQIFTGFLIAKRPELSYDILGILNKKKQFAEIMSFRDLITDEGREPFGYDEDRDIDKIYYYFADFCNLTQHLKARVNAVLILASEYYI